FIEEHLDATEVNLFKDRDQPQLAHDGYTSFYHAGAAQRSCRYAANPDRFVDVFLQIHVERVLQQPGETMIVLGRDYDETVATLDRVCEFRVLHLLAGVIEFHWQRAHIDKFRFHVFSLFRLLKNEL